MLGSNLRKKNFTFLSIFILILKIGLKFFLTKNNKTTNCKKPAIENRLMKLIQNLKGTKERKTFWDWLTSK